MKSWRVLSLGVLLVAGGVACTKKKESTGVRSQQHRIGLVLDVGGRGDHSFNDSALRGLELWAAGKQFSSGRYQDAPPEQVTQSIPIALRDRKPPIQVLPVTPLVLQSRAQEDYEPNIQLLADQGASLVVGVGFLLENAVEAVARRHPEGRFLLIDSPILDANGKAIPLPNVRTLSFREEEGSFLVGALAGLVTKTGKVGFVGGIEIPLVKRFEVGFKAGVATTRPGETQTVLASYTGSFDNVAVGKQVAQDLIAKGADVIFHAAGSDGLGVIQAVKEARAAGKNVWAIGVDSDQSHLAPDAVLTSMIKGIDLAIYDAARAISDGSFTGGDQTLGLAEAAVGYAPIRVDFPGKDAALARVEALRQQIISGDLKVPSTPAGLSSFKASP